MAPMGLCLDVTLGYSAQWLYLQELNCSVAAVPARGARSLPEPVPAACLSVNL